jgi:MarR family transcriptional regulator for hemolysin
MSNKNESACATDIYDIEYLVCHVGLLWRRLLNAQIKTLGFSGNEKRVLFCIAHNPGLTQVQIATLLDLEPQNLMRSLDKLEQQQLIAKQADPKNRRTKCLYIQPAAKHIIEKIKTLSDQIKPQILTGIDAKEIKQVVDTLARMRENIAHLLDKSENNTE